MYGEWVLIVCTSDNSLGEVANHSFINYKNFDHIKKKLNMAAEKLRKCLQDRESHGKIERFIKEILELNKKLYSLSKLIIDII